MEMLGHLGKYQRKRIEFVPARAVLAAVNPQEIKQVVLNLLTNALDSLDDGGTVRVELDDPRKHAVLRWPTTAAAWSRRAGAPLRAVFHPPPRRAGHWAGTSITYRIIADHGGDIEAPSDGPGRGSTFRVRLPLRASSQREGARQITAQAA